MHAEIVVRIFFNSFVSHLCPLPCGARKKVPREGFDRAFLVPYVIFIVLFALPVMFLQLSYSQYSNLGPGKIAHVQTITGALMDNFPHSLHRKKFLITAILCLIGFVCGIPCVTQGGVYVLTLIDWYCASISIMFLAFMESFVLAWLYGVDQLFEDIEMMLGYKPSSLWKVMWKFVTPLITLIVWLWSVINLKPVRYGNYVYPMVAVGIGWVIALASMAPIPIGMTHTLCHIQGSFKKVSKHNIQQDTTYTEHSPQRNTPSGRNKQQTKNVNNKKGTKRHYTLH
ncbi:hypothetical protein FSP39_004176 [Pinctada imbricata]|uniref:Uncharacterized protein n=1 Tax=Pinctada imbricata TaxID=66713 RepID=A0AA89C7U6_PINIB|nr:hypothetical protein FSP39_004176 [Pinctada imbricata]